MQSLADMHPGFLFAPRIGAIAIKSEPFRPLTARARRRPRHDRNTSRGGFG